MQETTFLIENIIKASGVLDVKKEACVTKCQEELLKLSRSFPYKTAKVVPRTAI